MEKSEMVEFLIANGFNGVHGRPDCYQRNNVEVVVSILDLLIGPKEDGDIYCQIKYDRFFNKEHFIEFISHYEADETFLSEAREELLKELHNIVTPETIDYLAERMNFYHGKYGGN